MKKCELCGQQARMFCESDQANLCWNCDEKVHCANFLVAKHSRSLLCHVCQSPTPWTASGRKLTPTVSVCEGCVEVHGGKCEQGAVYRRDNEEEVDGGDEFDDGESFESYEGGESEEDEDEYEEEEEEEEEDEDEEEDGDNQVVPWSFTSASSTPPPPAVSSSSEGEISAAAGGASKRRRDYSFDLDSDDEIECSSAPPGGTRPFFNDEATSSSSVRPQKQARVTGPIQSASTIPEEAAELKSTAVVRTIQRLQNRLPTDIKDASKMIFGICKMSRDQNR